jgi:hypothetical protein
MLPETLSQYGLRDYLKPVCAADRAKIGAPVL